MSAATQSFNIANPHALARIVDASTSRRIVASQDIFDERGTKLWARNQPISHSLHERLLERKLKQPLEACLRAEDGVTTVQLCEALTSFLESDHALAQAVQPWALRLLDEVQRLPLHAAVELLLTAAHATQPRVFEHAVRGMALAGALQASIDGDRFGLRVAMLGGLLHDIGEMYVNPQYLDGGQPLDVQGYRHLVTHPRTGELLLATMTDYPPALARAVGEHHERLDGNGYPMRRAGPALSPLGRLLAVTEVVLAIANAPTAPLTRASLALRMIPGEFDAVGAGFIADAAQRAGEDLDALVQDRADGTCEQLARIDTVMTLAHERAASLAERSDASALVRDAAARCASLLQRLRLGWNAMGLWSPSQGRDAALAEFERRMAGKELRYRLGSMQRDCLWQHPPLNEHDTRQLQPLWDSLVADAQASPSHSSLAPVKNMPV